ncbi:MAG: TauD/TfdA dioxygenase family protein [Panacagrimonas sp.]
MNPAASRASGPSSARALRVTRWSGSVGALIEGVDLATGLDPVTVADIRAALLAHGVVFFQEQSLSPQQLVQVARCFGEPMHYPQLPGLPEAPLVTAVLKREQEKEAFGGVWHSDTTYLQTPPMATLLYGVEVPPQGGDTLFANQYLAYENLSAGLRQTLRGLRGLSSSAKAEVSRTREDRLREIGRDAVTLEAEHPIVRTHPETGRQALYVNVAHTRLICGWTEDESRGLLEYLFSQQTRPEYTCRWRWSPGALAIWDNRCVQHLPVNDYHGHRRLMHRVTLVGDVPV